MANATLIFFALLPKNLYNYGMTYIPTIGLEIHTELKTKTKMFCGCDNDFNEKHPNINVCPICLGHPGTLPVINKKAVESVLKLGLALGGNPPSAPSKGISKFDRKNYFYPDLPKGYQISQYDQPLISGGQLNGIRLTRIHLEEDAARLAHQTKNPRLPSPDGEVIGGQEKLKTKSYSLVDFNRAGVPLMELVTEPDIKDGKKAVEFAKELQLVLRYLEISDADMEKGQMRIEANISVSKDGKLGTKVEIKNLNSFRAAGEAIDYEIKRQSEVLDRGEQVEHETRGWDENKKNTVSQRSKEKAHDYRYFPEPDLPPLDFNESNAIDLRKLRIEIPELPANKRKRFIEEYRLSSEQVEVLVSESSTAQYFEESVSELLEELQSEKSEKKKIEAMMLLFNYLTSDIRGLANEKGVSVKDINITPENFADLIVLIIKGEITSRLAKDILKEMSLTGLDPWQIIQDKGLGQISDEKIIKEIIKEIVSENQKAVEDYKKGKENVLQFLFGQVMGKLKGQANPDVLRNLLQEELRK